MARRKSLNPPPDPWDGKCAYQITMDEDCVRQLAEGIVDENLKKTAITMLEMDEKFGGPTLFKHLAQVTG